MLPSDKLSLRIRFLKKWPREAVYWAPNPNHSLKINPLHFQRAKKSASLYRKRIVENKFNAIKSGLLSAELDHIVQQHGAAADAIGDQLALLQSLTGALSAPEAPANSTQPQSSPDTVRSQEDAMPDAGDKTTTITVAPGDSGFTFVKNFRSEFLSGLYVASNNWLPSYGPWYTAMTANAMQRRVFPKELKGTTNLKNSTSLRLMTEVLDTISSINADFYTDERNLSDFNAALCILNAYYCKVNNTVTPSWYWDLLNDLGAKISFFIDGLKNMSSPPGTGFKFTFPSSLQKAAIAPLNNETRYNKDFFSSHKIYHLLLSSNVIFASDTAKIPGSSDGPDYIYTITSIIFGANIPPFGYYQLNLRTGIKGLEYLILTYLTLTNAQISKPSNRRLQLKTLMGPSFEQTPPPAVAKKNQVFTFLVEEYIKPIIKQSHLPSTTEFFPGLALVALEAGNLSQLDVTKHFVNLAGTKFNKLFNVINQKLVFKDARELLMARSELRVALEDGLAVLLSGISPVDTVTGTIKTQFGGGDDYDSLYFLVMGCLPVSMAVV